ncbi:class I SAM-dependent methyltransferase [Amycolatopsis sp., V23-08]|uniref:Class I SAM-dependent methyltransferase n=1 Tax=Amycolatopsis heterodermiae TaxID=3110235 RepID=A0ABU5R528_9PSEU|nr:class I SAM-dependent methyltransferase [Amycolatopsis sp., V23-08]MEA5361317.1 class I SAM-dependent methyltransferase [Amycolatopsis sp., V23-08]
MDLETHYATGPPETSRLARTPHGRLEYLRTRELLHRFLPGHARVLDVGGGTGVHAAWLAGEGHTVHLVDVVPGHVATASAVPGVTARVGDARQLAVDSAAWDVVLLLGPLYHLVDAADRARALAEARRVLRPGGLVAAAGISRYLSLLETGAAGTLTDDRVAPIRDVVTTGAYDGHVGFVPTHWHTATELHDELAAAGFTGTGVYGVEGPAWPALDEAGLTAFDSRVEAALRAARLAERDPHLVHASAHLLALARRPA